MKLFGKAKKAPPPSESIAKLRKTVEMLEKREDYLEKRIQQEVAVARANSSSNKKKAMMALRRKKLMESQIEKLSGARLNLETQMMYLEGATVDKATFDAMRGAASALQGIQKDM
jgi:charged multivesicular body protein 4A/B